MKIAVACGGTGGHIFPGIVTARELVRRGYAVTLWISGRDVETVSTKDWDGPVQRVRAAGFPSGFNARSLVAAGRLFTAYWVSLGRMMRNRPRVLLAMGSYASVGPALAARTLGVPVVLHEANAIPGRAVEFLSRFACTAGVTFESAKSWLRCPRIVRTGLPIRSHAGERFGAQELEEGAFTVLVMGGSQGARRLNEVVTESICDLQRQGRGVQTIHLAGPTDEEWVRDVYQKAGVKHRVYGFLQEIGMAYHAAHLAISRAGAGACTELADFQVPSLLVPLPSAMRDHQTANAASLVRIGGADVLPQKDLTPARVAGYIEECRRRPEKLEAMRTALKGFAVPDAAVVLADLVVQAGAAE
jgi:UDP-N-acetylglucosamine--N-acetylmuramyl-(pentapeptide) pyrophosphoryl-undecaprenol N-acetylglucosamine transferase